MSVTANDISSVRALTTGLQVVFQEAYEDKLAHGERVRISTEIPTNSEAEDYAWLGATPAVSEFLDERKVKGLKSYSYTIRNKTWENTVAIDRAAVDHDKFGLIRARVQDLAFEAARYQDQLVFETMQAGFAEKAYDGKAFFADRGAEGCNVSHEALSAASLQKAITAMMMFKDDQGKPLGIVPDTLVVPPALQWTARELLESVYYPDAPASGDSQKLSGNVLKGVLKLVVSPYLGGTTAKDNDWFVLSTGRVVKPIIFQLDSPVEFDALENESESGFMRAQYLYGTYARYNAGYGLWQLAYASDGGE